ncbi:MAG: hypothetical protein OSP8Acid_08490 [uncultured Acidilobus sp. OSP8]|jgi:hypothetical protein|nr:MAG: hypothetical protein OSP8Acid_08490 [uncultured Acidilobus sp. OSP8]
MKAAEDLAIDLPLKALWEAAELDG